MIYDLMPTWLRKLLNMDAAELPTDTWTWRHTCRYGRDPALTAVDYHRYMRRGCAPRPTPWLFRDDGALDRLLRRPPPSITPPPPAIVRAERDRNV